MANALLCVTVMGSTTAELRRARDEAAATADLVELRLDTVRDPDIAGALAGRRRPVIVTCRPAWEGGRFTGSEEERHRMLADALAQGAEFVDVEWRARFDDLVALDRGRRVVLSTHDFDRLPDDLADRARAMRATGAEIIKIAAMASRLTDCLTLRDLASSDDAGRQRSVVIGMGEYGLPTRIAARKFGSCWTYAGDIQRIGQLTPGELLDVYRFPRISESTDLYGLVGSPVGHSVSPAMHNAAFGAADIDAVYLPLRAADADDFVTFGRAMDLKGASVTIPFKVALLERFDEADAVSRRVGAVNTMRAEGGRWIGANTDVAAFLRPLADRVPLAGIRASVLGAGGAARAVAIALASSKASVTVHARDRERASRVAMSVSAQVGPWPPARGTWDLLVNCTPIGMHPHVDETPLDAPNLAGGCVYDLVYNPTPTRLLREAASAGCKTIGGLEMLVAQAEDQFRWWTGVRPRSGVMRDAAMKRLAEFMRDEDYVV